MLLSEAVVSKVVDNGMCTVQVIFFVGVQLDITMPPTPKAATAANAAAGSSEPAEAAIANAGVEQAGQQTGIPESPAASQQAQSQVCLLCCTGSSTTLQAQRNKCGYTCVLLADLHIVVQAKHESLPDWLYLEYCHLRHVCMSKLRQSW